MANNFGPNVTLGQLGVTFSKTQISFICAAYNRYFGNGIQATPASYGFVRARPLQAALLSGLSDAGHFTQQGQVTALALTTIINAALN